MEASEWHPALTHNPGILLGEEGETRCVRADPASPKARPAKHRGFSLALRPTRSLSAMGVPEEGNWCSIACCDSPEGRCSYTFWPRQYGATEGSRCSSDGARLHAGKQTGQQMMACVGDCEGRQHRRKAPSKVIGVAASPALLHTFPAPPSINR